MLYEEVIKPNWVCKMLWVWIYNLHITLIIHISISYMLSSQPPNQPIYKKIDNYVFNFEEVLGQGNFSKVYKGRKEDTSKAMMI
jgi:hypothetical protein